MNPTGAALVSGEGVALDLPTAGIGSRALAVALDVLIQAVGLLIVLAITAASTADADDASVAAIVIVETVLVLAGYPILFEWLAHGRTPGKMALGLRVVRDDGGPIAFRQALVRGLAGLVVEKPGVLAPISTFVALGTIASSNRDKRVGDMLAGTVVLNERAAPQPTAHVPLWVPPALQPWALSLDLGRFDERHGLAVRQFVSRAYAMTPEAQAALGDQLCGRVLALITPPPPAGTPAASVLQTVLAERRRRSGEQVVAPWPGWAQQRPLVQGGAAPRATMPQPRPAPRPSPSARPDDRPASDERPGDGGFTPPA